jgi:hypothetical protein
MVGAPKKGMGAGAPTMEKPIGAPIIGSGAGAPIIGIPIGAPIIIGMGAGAPIMGKPIGAPMGIPIGAPENCGAGGMDILRGTTRREKQGETPVIIENTRGCSNLDLCMIFCYQNSVDSKLRTQNKDVRIRKQIPQNSKISRSKIRKFCR